MKTSRPCLLKTAILEEYGHQLIKPLAGQTTGIKSSGSAVVPTAGNLEKLFIWMKIHGLTQKTISNRVIEYFN